jgi:hypothetical protein
MMIPLVIALWEGSGYHGHKRLLVEDTPKLDLLGFNDAAHAIGVHPGPDYDAWTAANGEAPFVVLYENDDYQGKGLVLDGGLGDLNTLIGGYDFNGITSSVRICPPILRQGVDIHFLGVLGDPQRTPTLDAPIRPIPLVVELYVDVAFQGKKLVVVENSSNLAADFGDDFRASASSVQVIKGPNYNGEVARLYPQEGFNGQPLVLQAGSFIPSLQLGSYPNLVALNFNDQARSITVR